MKKIFVVVAVALLLGACREGNVVEQPNKFESSIINQVREALILDAVQLSAELTDDKKGLKITTSVQVSPSEYEIYIFTDLDSNGTLDQVYDYQICENVVVTDYHHKIFKKAARALLVEA